MELLIVIAWLGFLVYIAAAKTETLQLHLLGAWAILFLFSFVAFVKLLASWLRT